MIEIGRRAIFDAEHALFREQVCRFVAGEFLPHIERYEEQGVALAADVPDQTAQIGRFQYLCVLAMVFSRF